MGVSLNVLDEHGTAYNEDSLMGLVAHEMGHQFGIPDAYPGSGWSAKMIDGTYLEPAMMYSNGAPLVIDVFTIVTSRQNNKMLTRRDLNSRTDWYKDFDLR